MPTKLNTWYYSDADATVRLHLDASRRVSTFDEVQGGLDETTALFEARRCLSCGNCFECDNCYGVRLWSVSRAAHRVQLPQCGGPKAPEVWPSGPSARGTWLRSVGTSTDLSPDIEGNL